MFPQKRKHEHLLITLQNTETVPGNDSRRTIGKSDENIHDKIFTTTTGDKPGENDIFLKIDEIQRKKQLREISKCFCQIFHVFFFNLNMPLYIRDIIFSCKSLVY